MSETTSPDLTARARLRMAALRLFAERGFEAASTRAIAAEAGVSHALLRHHFGSKEGLRRAVDEDVLDTFDRILADLDAPADGDGLMAAFGTVTARLFGADELRRDYLRRALLEGSAASGELFRRLLDGARVRLDQLRPGAGAEPGPEAESDRLWAPYQVLFLILGPMLLEPVMRHTLDQPVFAPEVLHDRSAANQRLLARGLLAPRSGRDR
ncbi:TetR/AcrR family transcriptional regulator [Marinitenerispora sediminis]|uniref:TetR family transcriptional regulator n=1 Tax=Marinitenerispora sediminis TaxID=1931232 RepID=A0A368T267_9ACTN|nr:TetR/AcrR family transcriptional regulator [Marinitenerispora sediminis]RCV54718.1 TetR family transcriptional regulator [Marinitenerispora sediminis]RCV54996.1 TetR family transcriptional regulator [Marinitenerispora sediminis]RCV59968.1 TetR family transcriptional regulator [Marinitenerispora sediminis]